ncbi:MAG: flagellar hook-basal body complex protein FliE [Acidobacteria bacterium]|nr:flagellar hook-basal body complex protein FliE [Acidobacteriota bacterium]
MAVDAITAKVITGVATTGATKGGIATPSAAGSDGESGFGASLARLVSTIEEGHDSANSAVTGMLRGQLDVHDAMIALQRADLTLQFGVQVRNKLVGAYQEIMRMPV